MRLSLDYDNTYTRDPKMWDEFIKLAQRRGHEVICVTMRYPKEGADIPCEVVYTERQAKGAYCEERGISIDIWIDDTPAWIFNDSDPIAKLIRSSK